MEAMPLMGWPGGVNQGFVNFGYPSLLKDTKHVINLLNMVEWQPTYLLVTADVASLYTAISHQLGHEAVRHFLSLEILLFQPNRVIFILELLDFAMTHNYFWHDGAYYLQIKGVAMGAKFAHSMANIFMSKWEEEIVSTQ